MRWIQAVAAGGLVLAAGAAAAGEKRDPISAFLSPPFTVTLGAEARLLPRWDGSADQRFLPLPVFSIRPAGTPYRFQSPRDGIAFGLIDTGNFRFGPVGKLRTPHKASNDAKLAGLGDVGWTVEAGAFVEYWWVPWLRTRAEVRQGIGGHSGIVGDLMADAVWPVTHQLMLSAGPRITFASAAALNPYFGVDAAQSVASGLPAYDARGGLRSYGAGAQARYAWTRQWATHVYAEYERLAASPGDSPIVTQRGSRDQWTFGAGITYTFDIGW